MVLRIVLFKLAFLLFKFDTGCCELLPKIFDVNSAHWEVAGYCHIRLRVKLFRCEFNFSGADSGLNLGVLALEPSYFFLGEVLKLVKFVFELILLQFNVTLAHLWVWWSTNSLPLELSEHFHPLLKLLILCNLWMIRIILRKERSCRHKPILLIALPTEWALTLHCVIHGLAYLIELCKWLSHLLDH